MNYFAKFEKFLPHSIIIPSFMAVGSHMPELDWGAFLPFPPYKLGCQNTPHKLGLNRFSNLQTMFLTFKGLSDRVIKICVSLAL